MGTRLRVVDALVLKYLAVARDPRAHEGAPLLLVETAQVDVHVGGHRKQLTCPLETGPV